MQAKTSFLTVCSIALVSGCGEAGFTVDAREVDGQSESAQFVQMQEVEAAPAAAQWPQQQTPDMYSIGTFAGKTYILFGQLEDSADAIGSITMLESHPDEVSLQRKLAQAPAFAKIGSQLPLYTKDGLQCLAVVKEWVALSQLRFVDGHRGLSKKQIWDLSVERAAVEQAAIVDDSGCPQAAFALPVDSAKLQAILPLSASAEDQALIASAMASDPEVSKLQKEFAEYKKTNSWDDTTASWDHNMAIVTKKFVSGNRTLLTASIDGGEACGGWYVNYGAVWEVRAHAGKDVLVKVSDAAPSASVLFATDYNSDGALEFHFEPTHDVALDEVEDGCGC